MPLESIHKLAFKAAEAANCAQEQGKYWEMHDRLFANQQNLEQWTAHAEAIGLDLEKFNQCLSGGSSSSRIRRDMEAARKLGVTGTPAFFLAYTDPKSSKVRTLAALVGAKAFADFKTEIERLLSKTANAEMDLPGDAAARAPSRPMTPIITKTFRPEVAEKLARVLAAAPEGSPAWIAAPASDPRAVSRAEDLAAIFKRAGWKVRAVVQSAISIKPGTYLFAADQEPPAYVEAVRQALEEAGLSPVVANGYRQYYDEKARSDRSFRGFAFAPDQTFLLVVGRLP
jgi:hypothetical protein